MLSTKVSECFLIIYRVTLKVHKKSLSLLIYFMKKILVRV